MAPTVYLSELSAVMKYMNPRSQRRQRHRNGAVAKHQRLQLIRLNTSASSRDGAPLSPPQSPLWEPECPNDCCAPTIVSSSSSNISVRVPADLQQHWKMFLARRKGLLDIVVRTIALVRRNNILQERVNALRAETRDFINSVLSNPENKCLQQKLNPTNREDEDVSSSTGETIQRPSLPPTPDSTNSTTDDVTSTCDSREYDSERSCDDES